MAAFIDVLEKFRFHLVSITNPKTIVSVLTCRAAESSQTPQGSMLMLNPDPDIQGFPQIIEWNTLRKSDLLNLNI